jgi:hypothetical protein
MTGRMARNKGARGENELAAILSDELGFVVKRKLGQARDGADDIEVGKFRIEVKRRETLAIMQWCRQIEACTPKDQVPLVVFRQNGEEWRVVMRMKDLIPLMREEIAGPTAYRSAEPHSEPPVQPVEPPGKRSDRP